MTTPESAARAASHPSKLETVNDLPSNRSGVSHVDMAAARGMDVGASDSISRTAAIAICEQVAAIASEYALTGEPDNARGREAMEAAATRIRHRIVSLPAVLATADQPADAGCVEADQSFADGFRDALECVAQAKEGQAEYLADVAGTISRTGDPETAAELRAMAKTLRCERALADALSRYVEFHAYSVKDPRAIRFVFASVADQLAAADAMDAIVKRTGHDPAAAALRPADDGGVLVPAELTIEMVEAGRAAAIKSANTRAASDPARFASDIFTAMLAARPKPEVVQDGGVERLAAEAIRRSFFTSVSGEKPHLYYLSLTYQSMDEMHAAEDAIKAWAKSVLEPTK